MEAHSIDGVSNTGTSDPNLPDESKGVNVTSKEVTKDCIDTTLTGENANTTDQPQDKSETLLTPKIETEKIHKESNGESDPVCEEPHHESETPLTPKAEVEDSSKSTEELDPYAYLQRPEFSSENFKIEIMNLPAYYGAGDIKKFMKKLEVNPNKMKMMKKFAFASFRSEKERDDAMQKLKGSVYKGKTIDVKLAKPIQDPLIRKRKAIADDTGSEKKPKLNTQSIAEQVASKAASFADKSYDEQLSLKKQEMKKVLTKLTKEIIGAHSSAYKAIKKNKDLHGAICEFSDMIPSPCLEKYRNKCEFTVGVNPETDVLTLGFRVSTYKEGSIAVGPIDHLAFIPDAMKEVVRVFEAYFRASNRKAYNPEDHSGFWRQVLVRTNLCGETMAIVAIHPQNLSPEELQTVKNELKAVAEENKIVSLYFQAMGPKKPGEEPPLEHLMGTTHLVEKLCGLEFSISPQAFFQVNTLAAEVLYNKIADIAEIDTNTDVLDVCCGTGTIGLSLAKKCRQVYGVEIIESAVEDAKKNAEKNGITNCNFVAGKAEDELDPLIRKIDSESEGRKSKIVAILDPPRAGLHRKCCQVLRSTERIERIVYISCNAQAAMKSFVDLCRAQSNAYTGIPFIPVKAMAVDLFPDTPHCEFILVLERYRPT